jgi:tetratricopeptide (TPR) repeat protein
MHRQTRIGRLATVLLISTLAVTTGWAAGSKPKPASDTEPGVAEYNAGVQLMREGAYGQAQAKFEAAIDANGKFAEAHNNLGYCLRKQGKSHYKQALEHYNRAIALNPRLAEAYMYRGVLFQLMGNEEKALADHAKLVELDRGLADALQAAIASGEEPTGLDGLAKEW